MGWEEIKLSTKISSVTINQITYYTAFLMALVSSSLLFSPFVKCFLTCIFLVRVGLCSVSKQHVYQGNVLNSFNSEEHRLIIRNRATIHHHAQCKVQT